MQKIQLNAYILVAIAALALIGSKSGRPLSIEGRPDTDFSIIPMELGEWYGQDGKFDARTYEVLPSASLLLRFYDHPEYGLTDLAIVYGTDLGDFHQPEMCLEGQGLRTHKKESVQIQNPDGSHFDAVGLISMDRYNNRRAYVYWFATDGETSTSLGYYKIKIFADRLSGRKVKPSAMIRIGTTVRGSDEIATERLIEFSEKISPYLNQEFGVKTGN